jgi:hypothetical protein
MFFFDDFNVLIILKILKYFHTKNIFKNILYHNINTRKYMIHNTVKQDKIDKTLACLKVPHCKIKLF